MATTVVQPYNHSTTQTDQTGSEMCYKIGALDTLLVMLGCNKACIAVGRDVPSKGFAEVVSDSHSQQPNFVHLISWRKKGRYDWDSTDSTIRNGDFKGYEWETLASFRKHHNHTALHSALSMTAMQYTSDTLLYESLTATETFGTACGPISLVKSKLQKVMVGTCDNLQVPRKLALSGWKRPASPE